MTNIKMLIQAYTKHEVVDSDLPVLTFIYESTTQHVKNDCNVSEIPEGLKAVIDEIVVGKYLLMRKTEILGDEAVQVVKSIKEGDTTVDLGGNTQEQRLDALIRLLLKERDFSCYRKFRW